MLAEYRILRETGCAASASLFFDGLHHTTLLQIARVDTGRRPSFSAYAVYREGAMTFEASARLAIAASLSSSMGQILRDLMTDNEFLDAMLVPMKKQVETHFALQRH